jgi:hypothetical protein
MSAALRELSPQRIAAILQGPSAAQSLKEPGFIFKALQRAIASADTAEGLVKVWAVLDALAASSLRDDTRLSTSAQRCVIELQSRDPLAAASVARQALESNLVLYPKTILATVSKAWENTKTLADVDCFVSLFECALRKQRLDLRHLQTIGQCDALLGALCDPSESPPRISRDYRDEGGLVGVGNRMLLGARLAQTVVEAGLVFDHERNIGRMSLTIWALSSIGSLASLQARFLAGEVSAASLTHAASEMKLRFSGLTAQDGAYDRAGQALVGPQLLRAALELAHYSFGTDVANDNLIRVYRRYALPAVTIASLFRELERSKLELGDSEREAIAVVVFCALEIESEYGDNLQPACLNSALGLLVKKSKDQADDGDTATRRAQCVANLLFRGLPKITEVSFLEAAVGVFADAYDANPEGEKEYTAWLEVIEARVKALESKRSNRPTAHPQPPRSKQGQDGWFSELLDEQQRKSN